METTLQKSTATVDLRTMPLNELSSAIFAARQELNKINQALYIKRKEIRTLLSRIDQEIARNRNLGNDWTRRDMQMELREANEPLKQLQTEEDELIQAQRDLESRLELMRSIRVNRIIDTISANFGELLAPLLQKELAQERGLS